MRVDDHQTFKVMIPLVVLLIILHTAAQVIGGLL